MKILLKKFQESAVNELCASVLNNEKEIILKSPTGSGKTIILTSFIDKFKQSNSGYCFIWLTPGVGNLEEQSKDKMDYYFPMAETALLKEAISFGFVDGQTCFINWELVTKSTNISLMTGDNKNLKDIINDAQQNGLKFIVIIDEEHLNKTYKAVDILKLFSPVSIIRASATPHKNSSAKLIEISDAQVISEGLIKKFIYINEGVENGVDTDNQVSYLLNLALTKRDLLRKEYLSLGKDINPLIIIQMPNCSDALISDVENYLASRDITYNNKRLAKWLASAKDKINLDNITELNSESTCLIFKEAVATGWDCTRAHILVKLRDKMGDTFQIQTIGRIRRMPEAHHYNNSLLDVCYLYTFDETFKQGVKQTYGANAPEIQLLTLKENFKEFKLVKYFNPSVSYPLDPKAVCDCISSYLVNEYSLQNGKYDKNKVILEANGYNLDSKRIFKSLQGKVISATEQELKETNKIETYQTVNTSTQSIDFWNQVTDIGAKASLSYENARKILFRLFGENSKNKIKFLKLSVREMYAFVNNNLNKLKEDFYNSLTSEKYKSDIQATFNFPIIESEFSFPRSEAIGIDSNDRFVSIYKHNVYDFYPSNVVGRSKPEVLFEQWCENNTEWFYKNGESNIKYFSIIYKDNFGKPRHFYPDYILKSKSGQIWIIETKGGENISGDSEDIDKFSSFKFDSLKVYGQKFNINVGFVRYLEKNALLLINTEKYVEELNNENWKLLSDIVK